MMKIEKIIENNFAKLSLEGWLDTQTAPELGIAVDALEGVTSLELDFSKLEYISSAGLRQVVALHKKMNPLTITNVSPEIMEVFKMTGFDKRLHFE